MKLASSMFLSSPEMNPRVLKCILIPATMVWMAWMGLSCAAVAQQTVEFTPAYFKQVSGTTDGGYLIIHTTTSQLSYHKYDSNAVFQYGRQFPSGGGGVQANGKIFALLDTDNYFVDIAKVDMATGTMEVAKRIQGPTGGQTYFTPGPAQMIATKDSGLVLLLNPQQCMQIANCQSCMLKLDKNLNYQFFTHTQFNGGSGFLPSTPYLDENPDGSLVVAQSVYAPPGYPVVMVRYNGTTGAIMNSRSFNNTFAIPAILGLASNPGRILVGGYMGTDAYLVSLSNDLSTLHWGQVFAGLYGASSAPWTFRVGPRGNYYGHLGSNTMAVRPSGSLAWCKSADNASSMGNWVRLRQHHMVATYQPGYAVGRMATIDSTGSGLCNPTNLNPAINSFAMTQPTVSLSNFSQNNFTFTSLPLLPSVTYTPNLTVVCTPVCTFTATFTWTNSNLTYQFTSTPSGLTTYHWNFGDGGTSTLANPSHTYTAAGAYNVCLIGTSGCMSDTACFTVTVTCTAANAGFTTTLNQQTATFANTSTGTGPLTYSWAFGDGQTSTQANPSHAYLSPGYYTVCLVTTGACGSDTACAVVNAGCTNTTASYTASSNLLNATFTNGSTSTGTTTYFWDFGDGNGSTQTNPSHVYASPGTYAVCLIATSPCGADTSCQTVTVICPTTQAGFSASSNLFQASFTNSSTGGGVLSYLWDFGDGNTSTATNPAHTYPTAGVYTVCLVTTGACGADTVCDSLVVTCPLPVPAFAQSSNLLDVTFTNSSTGAGALSYFWDFGDGNTSTLAQPMHSYAQPGSYVVCLSVHSICGADTLCDTVTVTCPPLQAGFSSAGNFPAIQFTDLTSGSPTSWLWDFGDGGTATLQNPAHTYANPGNFTVCLRTADSCSSDTVCLQVVVLVGLDPSGRMGLEIQPNPASHLTRLSWPDVAMAASLRVYAADGRQITSVQGPTTPMMLDVSDWPAGIYFVELQLGELRRTHRLMVGL